MRCVKEPLDVNITLMFQYDVLRLAFSLREKRE